MHLMQDGKQIIDISQNQVHQFAGNMLQLKGRDEIPYLVMSQSAFDCLESTQIKVLENHGSIISSPLPTIEACGGGSARCMMAEIFLPKAT